MIYVDLSDYDNPDKHYTEVKAVFDTDGKITPLSMMYNNTELEIDRITDVRPAASLKSGGAGIRYTCYICSRKTFLFLEENRWFFEPCD